MRRRHNKKRGPLNFISKKWRNILILLEKTAMLVRKQKRKRRWQRIWKKMPQLKRNFL